MTAPAELYYQHVRNDGRGCLSLSSASGEWRAKLKLDVGAWSVAESVPLYSVCWLSRAAAGALALALLSPDAKAESEGLALWHYADDCDGTARLYPLFGGFRLEARDEGLEAVSCLLTTEDAAAMAARALEWCSSQDAAL